jgi:hypothetical protein
MASRKTVPLEDAGSAEHDEAKKGDSDQPDSHGAEYAEREGAPVTDLLAPTAAAMIPAIIGIPSLSLRSESNRAKIAQ